MLDTAKGAKNFLKSKCLHPVLKNMLFSILLIRRGWENVCWFDKHGQKSMTQVSWKGEIKQQQERHK